LAAPDFSAVALYAICMTKGAAGVTGSGFIVLAATLSSIGTGARFFEPLAVVGLEGD
jgi:Na+/H+-dicarboxylate symporter